MISNNIKRFASLLFAALLLASPVTHADDTEVYIGNNVGVTSGIPLVFFYVEYAANTNSTICTGVTAANLNTATEAASSCPAIWSVRNYMSPNDLADGDTTIDQFELTRAALKRVLIALGDVKVGLLMAHADTANCSGGPLSDAEAAKCSQGGYILKGLTPIAMPSSGFNPATATTTQIAAELALDAHKDSKKVLFDKLDALRSPQGNFSHPNQNKEVYFELFRYLTGQAIYNGHNGGEDFGTTKNDQQTGAFNLGGLIENNAKNRYQCASGYICDTITGTGRYEYITALPAKFNGDFSPLDNGLYISTKKFKWDTTIEDGSNYKPALTSNCEKVYVINVVDGGGSLANKADTAIKAAITAGGMGFNVSSGDTGFEEVVKWLNRTDLADGSINPDLDFEDNQTVTSFFIAKHPTQADEAAKWGGTGFAIPYTSNADGVVEAISNVFDRINDASASFTSAAIPVNVFNRSEVVDNAYIALFQPNDAGTPRWVGNVKKLKFKIYEQCSQFDTNQVCIKTENRLQLVDTSGTNAIDPEQGRISPTAITFWTKPNGYDLYDDLSTTNGAKEVAGSDGRSVHRGGAGQRIPGFLSGWANWDGSNYVNYTLNAANLTTGHLEAGNPGYRNLYTDSYQSNPKGDLVRFGNMYIDDFWKSVFIPTDSYSLSQWSQAVDYLLLTGDYNNDIWGTGSGVYYPGNMLYAGQTENAFICSGWYGYANGTCPEWLMYFEMYALYYQLYGYDVWDENSNVTYDTSGYPVDWNKLYESRRWLMGDPLHSRPLPINYGAPTSRGYSEKNPDIRIIVGSNDGYLRMIRNTIANCDPAASDCESGEEVWAFMPQNAMKVQKQLMDNVPYGTPFHPYGIDGSPTAYVKDSDGTIGVCTDNSGKTVTPCDDEALVFFGMRRGGQAYYGLDVTNPDKPKMLWKIDNTTPGFSELGYTYSQPVAREMDWGTGRKPVLIFGGGYDTDKDYVSPTEKVGTDDSIGNALYIVDAKTGALVWKATGNSGAVVANSYLNSEMRDSIPSEFTARDSDNDGMVDRIYVGDTGGRLWRFDTPGTNRSTWKATLLLDAGRHVTNDLDNDRRFFYAPDIVPSRDAGGYYDAIVIGSGDREHPLGTTTLDYMYMYKDRVISGPLPDDFTAPALSDLGDVTDNCIQQVIKNGCTIPDLTYGWQMRLQDDIAVQATHTGEKLLSSPLTVMGVIYFSTYVPTISSSGSTCSPEEGIGYAYAIDLGNAVAVFDYAVGNSVTDPVTGKVVDLQIEDRRVGKLRSPGIPSESVYVSYTDEDGKSIRCILTSDLNCSDDLGAQQYSTFWYEKQR